MLFIAENLKSLRKSRDLTQEEVAEMLNVSAQSVSKWERGDTLPDITLLPALANLYKVSVDALIGMDKINAAQTRDVVFTEGHKHMLSGDYSAAAVVFSDALKTFPNDEGFMSELAMALALDKDPGKLTQAIALCERVLAGNPSEKVRHTTRASLCFICLKAGEKEKAVAAAQNLPHVRESREVILAEFEKEPTADDIDAYLRFIALGESDEQDVITVDFGINTVAVFANYALTERIDELRGTDGHSLNGHRKLPQVRIRDNCSLSPNQIRVRYYADYLLDKEFSNHGEAADEIIAALRGITQE